MECFIISTRLGCLRLFFKASKFTYYSFPDPEGRRVYISNVVVDLCVFLTVPLSFVAVLKQFSFLLKDMRQHCFHGCLLCWYSPAPVCLKTSPFSPSILKDSCSGESSQIDSKNSLSTPKTSLHFLFALFLTRNLSILFLFCA